MHITYTGTIPSGSEPFKKTVSTEKETSEPRVHMVKIAPNTSRESVEKKNTVFSGCCPPCGALRPNLNQLTH